MAVYRLLRQKRKLDRRAANDAATSNAPALWTMQWASYFKVRFSRLERFDDSLLELRTFHVFRFLLLFPRLAFLRLRNLKNSTGYRRSRYRSGEASFGNIKRKAGICLFRLSTVSYRVASISNGSRV